MREQTQLMAHIYFLLIVLALTAPIQSAKVHSITESNYQKFSKDHSYWILQISKNPCPQCEQSSKELEEAALLLDGACKVGKLDARLLEKQGMAIPENPTYMFVVSDDLQQSSQFEGNQIDEFSLAKFCIDGVKKAIKQRHGELFAKSGQGKSKGQQNKKQTTKSSSNPAPSGKMIELTDQSFEEKVLKSKDAWFVVFYSPSCGHCQNMMPEYEKLPSLMVKKASISRIDATKHQQAAQKYQIKGFPTILFFSPSSKSEPVPYEGQRTAQAMQKWLNQQELNKVKKQLHLLSYQTYKEKCNRNIVCLVWILDSQSKKSEIKFIKPFLEEMVDKPFEFFFTVKGSVDNLERSLMIEDRQNPKMVAIWDGIQSYRVYSGGNSYEDLSEYFQRALERRRWIKFDKKPYEILFSDDVNQSEL